MDGAATPHVLTSEKRLSNFNKAGEGGEEGGGAASIAIAQGLGTRIEPAFGWMTNIEITNAEF